jgi:hypothetical protein
MLTVLALAVLFPLFVSGSKTAPIRGALLGAVLAMVAGFLVPTKTVRTTPMHVMSVNKAYSVDSPSKLAFTATLLDADRKVIHVNVNSDSLVLAPPQTNDVQVYRCTTTLQYPWMWMCFFHVPHAEYELVVPESRAYAFTSGIEVGKTELLYADPAMQPVQPQQAVAQSH